MKIDKTLADRIAKICMEYDPYNGSTAWDISHNISSFQDTTDVIDQLCDMLEDLLNMN